MPILSAIAAASAKAYGFIANALKTITDNFDRSNGSLGTSTTGDTWNATRGTWSISSNQATSSDSGSNYPMATIDIGAQNVSVSADITNGGPGVAFWVTDANSWWASSANYNSSSYSCNCSTYCSSYTCACGNGKADTMNCCCSYTTTYVCPSGCFVMSPSLCLTDDTYLNCGSPSSSTSCTGGYTCACGNAQADTMNCCCSATTCQTCYNDSITLTIYSSVSGTVTTQSSLSVWSGTSGSFTTTVGSILISTSSNTITAKAYSSTGLSSQVGSTLTYTASSPTKGTKVGIIKTPSNTNSGSTLDNFSATVNMV